MYVPVEQAANLESDPIIVVRTEIDAGAAAAELRGAVSALDGAVPVSFSQPGDVRSTMGRPRSPNSRRARAVAARAAADCWRALSSAFAARWYDCSWICSARSNCISSRVTEARAMTRASAFAGSS